MTPSSQSLESPANPGRFTPSLGSRSFAVRGLPAFAVRGLIGVRRQGAHWLSPSWAPCVRRHGLPAFAVIGLTGVRRQGARDCSPSGSSHPNTHIPKQSGVTGLPVVRRQRSPCVRRHCARPSACRQKACGIVRQGALTQTPIHPNNPALRGSPAPAVKLTQTPIQFGDNGLTVFARRGMSPSSKWPSPRARRGGYASRGGARPGIERRGRKRKGATPEGGREVNLRGKPSIPEKETCASKGGLRAGKFRAI